jgi:hypothetical protein
LAALALATACSSGGKTAAPAPSAAPSTPGPTPTAGLPSPTPSACPAQYLPPDANRPVVRLAFSVPADRRRITGTESVAFAPDRPVREIVFRLWVNQPTSRQAGGAMTPTSVVADDLASYRLESRDTLLRIRLQHTVPAGTVLHARIGFTTTLAVNADERFSTSSAAAWWGSGFPLLAYVRGEGYATEPATSLFAEAATSEEFRLADLAVTAPAGDTVLANGTLTRRQGRTWHFAADSVRDVAVTTGHFRIAHTTAAGVPITVGVTRTMPDDGSVMAGVIAAAVSDHVRRFGPFPYAQLTVALVPSVRGGIEFPGLIYLGSNQRDATPPHEVGHEWFYGLVGDDQARDPWLDEAFATYVEALQRGSGSLYESTPVPAAGRNRVGAPMTYWEHLGESTYFRTVYLQGASALLRARQAVGASKFDAAIRCYVNADAHRIARPTDLAFALRSLPVALKILRTAGALPG